MQVMHYWPNGIEQFELFLMPQNDDDILTLDGLEKRLTSANIEHSRTMQNVNLKTQRKEGPIGMVIRIK